MLPIAFHGREVVLRILAWLQRKGFGSFSSFGSGLVKQIWVYGNCGSSHELTVLQPFSG